MKRRDFMLSAAASGVCFGCVAYADERPLILDGDVRAGPFVSLDDDALLALPQAEFSTTTPWTIGSRRFSGPLLKDLLDHYGAGPGDLRLTAINAYSVIVDRNLVTQAAPIIANRIDGQPFSRRENGQPFSRRENGPFWVIYPYDDPTVYISERVLAASVWQLTQITVLGG